MTARTKVTLAGVSIGAATGLWLGYTRAAFFLPGMTIRKLRTIVPGGAA